MVTNKLPTISVLMPTMNREKTIGKSLESIRDQDYPQEKVEIIIADAGSVDRTVEKAKKFKVTIINNFLITAESGKAVALRKAKGELIALIDSDNLLPDKNWLKEMVVPFVDRQIIGAEPYAFTYRKSDGFIDRYCALIGMNDPYCLFQGIYDRFSYLTGKWTGVKLNQDDKGGYLKIELNKKTIPPPTIGANGTIFRRSFLKNESKNDYLFDIDVITSAINEKGKIHFAKVKNSIIHEYSGSNIKVFVKKQERRIRDNRFYRQFSTRKYNWGKINRYGILKFSIPTLLIFPLIIQSLIGFFKKRDIAWFFHPLACWLTLIVYSFFSVRGLFIKEKSRKWMRPDQK